jgi:hypothetical protein
MLTDPLRVVASLSGTEFTTLSTDVNDSLSFASVGLARVTDIGPGSSVRVVPEFGTYTIKHSSSKENAPLDTTRTLVRFDGPKKVDAASGNEYQLSAYLVSAQPICGDVQTADQLAFVRSLLFTLLFGEVGSDDKPQGPDLDFLSRVLAGEP